MNRPTFTEIILLPVDISWVLKKKFAANIFQKMCTGPSNFPCLFVKKIDYIMTDKPNMITYVRVINRINIGSDHRMLMSNIRLDTKAERKKLLRKRNHEKSTLEKLRL